MENEYSALWWSLGLVGVTVLSNLLMWLNTQRKRKTAKSPPSPRPWPIIGNLHQLTNPPHKSLYKVSQIYGPVASLRLGSVNTVVISSSEKAKEFFKLNDSAFASRPPNVLGKHMVYNQQDLVLAPYGPYWRQVRKMCVIQLLTAKRVESFAHVRRSEVDNLLEDLWEKSENGAVSVDLSEAFATVTTNIIWRIICGRKYAGNEEIVNGVSFKRLVEWISEVGGKFNIGDFIHWLDWMDLQGIRRSVKRLHNVYDVFAEKIIEDRLNMPNDSRLDEAKDFLDILLEVQNQNEKDFNKDSVKALIFDMAAAGTETSATAMEWSMSLLLKHPEAMKKCKKEIEQVVGKGQRVEEEHLDKLTYLSCVVKEAMRMYPPFPLTLPHYSIEDTEVSGYRVPKGSILFLNIWAIGRDPTVWVDSEDFRPERFMNDEEGTTDFRSIPFGAGRRGCPGGVMALPIILLTLASLVQRFDWHVNGQVDMTESDGITMPRRNHLFGVPKSF